MEFSEIIAKAKDIRAQYAAFEQQKFGREWNGSEIMNGFVGDVGMLARLVVAKEGMRTIRGVDDIDAELEHEITDCLWSVIVLANKYNVDLEQKFIEAMKSLEERIARGDK